MEKMITKSIKLSKEDAINLADIVKKDPRLERGFSEAIRICCEDAALHIPRWDAVLKESKDLDYTGEDTDSSKESSTISFLVGEDTFYQILTSVREQLGYARPRSTFVTRLCIKAARLRLCRKAPEPAVYAGSALDAAAEISASPQQALADFIDLKNTDEKLNLIYQKLLELESEMKNCSEKTAD